MKHHHMHIEGEDQPGAGASDAAAAAAAVAANTDGTKGTDSASTEGQGNSGAPAGSDASKTDGGNPPPPDGTDPNAGKTGDGQDPPPAEMIGAPEAYSAFDMPEGFVLEGERAEAAHTLFRKLNLSQAGAQEAVNEFTRLAVADEGVRALAMEQAIADQREAWGQEAKAELGEKYDAEVAMAKTAVTALDNPKLLEAFNTLGWGNHGELIKAFATFGRMMRDSPTDGIGKGGSTPAEKKPWEIMYDGVQM